MQSKKKRIKQLDSLLDWEKEKRLPETKELFNRLIGDKFTLKEIAPRMWQFEVCVVDDKEKTISRTAITLRHTDLIQLGLTILDAVKETEEGR